MYIKMILKPFDELSGTIFIEVNLDFRLTLVHTTHDIACITHITW